MPHGNQILIRPLGIDKLNKQDKIIGFSYVCNRWHPKRRKAFVYLNYNSDKKEETYKVVIGKHKVIGYCILHRLKKELHIPLLGSLDRRYHLGKILADIAFWRLLNLNMDKLCLTSSWNSLLYYLSLGFDIKDQYAINGQDYDAILSVKDLALAQELGSITMYLPEEILKEKYEQIEQPLLDSKLMRHKTIDVGNIQLLNKVDHKYTNIKISKEFIAKGVDKFSLIRKKDSQVLGIIVLNYFKWHTLSNGKRYYGNIYGAYPSWSIFYNYGSKEKGVNKTFAEFWSIIDSKEYEYEEILNILFQIALEAGKYNKCPRLQIEADWDEYLSVFDYGFKCQDFNHPKTAQQITKIIKQDTKSFAENSTPINLNKFGSVELFLSKEKVQQKRDKLPYFNLSLNLYQRIMLKLRYFLGF